jgi:putative heme iron utilization protein
MTSAVRLEIARLVLDQRWAALATLHQGLPLASMVAYASEPGLEGLLFFVSELALHTRNLLEEPRASLAITAPDTGEGDPQLLPRVTLGGRAEPVERETDAFAQAGARYLAHFPDAAPRFGLSDFLMFRFVVSDARYVGGFARAVTLTGEQLREAARAL